MSVVRRPAEPIRTCRLTGGAGLRHVEETGQIGPPIDHGTNDMRVINSHLRLALAKTRRNAYEIPTWAIADAIRRRTNKAKTAVPDEPTPSPPQTPPDTPEVTAPSAIAFAAASPKSRVETCPTSGIAAASFRAEKGRVVSGA